MNPDQINYQPLEAMKGAYSKVLTDSLRGGLPLVILVLFVIVEVALIVAHEFFLTLYPFFGYLVYLGFQVNKFKNNVWQAFAATNGWPLDQTTPPAELVPPSLQFGHSPGYSPVVQAQLGTIACDLLTYNCTTGAGKSQQMHYFTVARVGLPKSLPHILLMSKKAHADIQRDLANGQKLQLEGDFNDYFTLQIEKGQQIDVLEVLTPDVMQTLVSYDAAEDVEILGDQMYFIMGGDKRDGNDVKLLIRSVTELNQQIVQNINLSSVPAVGVNSPV